MKMSRITWLFLRKSEFDILFTNFLLRLDICLFEMYGLLDTKNYSIEMCWVRVRGLIIFFCCCIFWGLNKIMWWKYQVCAHVYSLSCHSFHRFCFHKIRFKIYLYFSCGQHYVCWPRAIYSLIFEILCLFCCIFVLLF